MQTTLRIDDDLYRQAKAEAAREGVTLTQFIHEALALRLRQTPKVSQPLPTFDSGQAVPADYDLIGAIRASETDSDRVNRLRLE